MYNIREGLLLEIWNWFKDYYKSWHELHKHKQHLSNSMNVPYFDCLWQTGNKNEEQMPMLSMHLWYIRTHHSYRHILHSFVLTSRVMIMPIHLSRWISGQLRCCDRSGLQSSCLGRRTRTGLWIEQSIHVLCFPIIHQKD